jgi:hypothetical protein
MNRNITALILIVLGVGIYFTFTQGQIDVAREILAKNSQYVSAINNAKQLVSVRDKVNSDYSKLGDDDRMRLNKMLPSSADNIHLIVDLNGIAEKHGLILKNIKAEAVNPTQQVNTTFAQNDQVSPSIIAPTLSTVRVTFDVSAPYLQFISLMNDLESSLRILDLTRLSVRANDVGVYEYSVELKTYWLRQ